MSSSMLLFSRSRSISHPMKYMPCIAYCPRTLTSWYVPVYLRTLRYLTWPSQTPTRDDTLRVILMELDGVPHIGNDELHDARDTAVELQLTNRFAHVKGRSHYPIACTHWSH